VTTSVVIGSGSAGRRHAATLRDLDSDGRVILVQRPGSTNPCGAVQAQGVEVVTSLELALEQRPSLGVVASPSPLHAPASLQLLDHGCRVLIEKPLGSDLSDPAVQSLCERQRDHARLLVGYHLRFSDTATRVRDVVRSGKIGVPVSVDLAVGQQLSTWRPGVTVSDTVSGRVELGGGVLLELSHELDAVRFILDTEVSEVRRAGLLHDGAPTDGEVETVADLELLTESGVVATVHLDMVSDPPVRRWQVTGSLATIVADLLTSRIMLERPGRDAELLVAFPAGERDRAEANLVGNLLGMLRNGDAPRCTIADGVAALAIVEASRRCAATGRPSTVAMRTGVPG